jgi:hypothetical protein
MIPLCYFNRESWWIARQRRLRIMRLAQALKSFRFATLYSAYSMKQAALAFDYLTQMVKENGPEQQGEMKVNRGN